MKQNNITTALFAGIMTFAGAALPVSAAETLHVKVPFSFVVNGARMDAGDYSITPLENGVVSVSGAKNSAMVLTVPSDYTRDSGLSFTTSGSNSVLTGVRLGGAVTREIPLHSVAERKVALVSAR